MNNSIATTNKYKVTVIIPTYNSQKFIHRALDSIVRQTMSAKDIEVIVVNDCSTDGTLDVVRGYKKSIANLRIENTDKNTGNPVAGRNMGIELSQGEYIHFIDHDDWIGDEALDRLYSAAQEWGSDVIFGKNAEFENSITPTAAFSYGDIPKVDPFYHPKVMYALAPHKMFRRKLLLDNNIRFYTDVIYGEDQPVAIKAYTRSKVVSVKADYDYYYRYERPDGNNLTTHQKKANHYEHNYRTKVAIQEIAESSLTQEYKDRWTKLCLQRALGQRAPHILRENMSMDLLNAVDRFVLDPAAEHVIESLDPVYKLPVAVVRARNVAGSKMMVGEITKPRVGCVSVLGTDVYIKAQSEVFHAGLLYKKLAYEVRGVDIRGDELLLDVAIDFELHPKARLDKDIVYKLRIEDEGREYSRLAVGKRTKKGIYRFAVNLKNAHKATRSKRLNFATYLYIESNDICLPIQLGRHDTRDYKEKAVTSGDKHRTVRMRSNYKGDLKLVASENQSLRNRVRRLIKI